MRTNDKGRGCEEIVAVGEEGGAYPGFAWPRYTMVPNDVFDIFLSVLTPAGFKVLAAMAHEVMFHNRETGLAAMSRSELQKATKMSYNTVLRAVQECLDAGVIAIVEPPNFSPALSTMYTLHFRDGEGPSRMAIETLCWVEMDPPSKFEGETPFNV